MNKREFLKTSLIGLGILHYHLPDYGITNHLLSNEIKSENMTINKEAMFYSNTAKGILCELCPNECILKNDKVGSCRTRINKNGKLITKAYNNPCAIHIDPVEKKPLLHFFPGTKTYSIAIAGCNLACLNCQNWTISQKSPDETRNYDLTPQQLIESVIKSNCKSISYTYTEPIAYYEYTYDSAKIARNKNIKNIMVSAGYINEKPIRELAKFIDAANIDLKCFDNEIYKKLNGGQLQPVLNTLKILHESNVWLEITNLIVPNWTDNLDMIKRMCEWLVTNKLDKYPIHFSRFHPMYKLTNIPSTPVSVLEKAREIAISAGMKYVYIGNVPGTNWEDTFCPKCKKKVIERNGFSILENNIKDGKCKYCNQIIDGVWQ